MKKFLLKIVVFILPFVLVFSYLEYNLGSMENSYTYKRSNLEERVKGLEVLCFGSSHSYMGIDPDYFDYTGYNMANVSQSTYYDYELFHKYNGDSTNLKVVILPVSYFTFGTRIINGTEYWRGFFYKRFFDIPLENLSKVFDIKCYSFFYLYGRDESISYIKSRFSVNLVPTELKKNGSFMEKNFVLEEFMKNITEEAGKARAKAHTDIYNKDNVISNKLYLKKIIKECIDRGIVPVIITTPVFRTYSVNMDPQIWAQTQAEIVSISKEFGIGYYNYLNDNRFVKEDFRDNDHLNPNGAAKFSKIINDEILIQIIN